MLLLNKDDIQKVFTMKDAIEADKEAYKMLSSGETETPLRNVFRAKKAEGDILFMPGFIDALDVAGLKVVSIFPNNVDKGLPTATGTVFLVSGETGEVVSIMDGTYITAVRTGAASGAAIDLLAKKDCKKACLIGTGGQGEAQLEAILTARDLEEVYVYSRKKEKREKFAKDMAEKFQDKGVKIVAASDSDEAVENADIIVLATTSKVPTFDASKVSKGALISGIGSYTKEMDEIDDKIFEKTDKIYFDSKDAVLSESGDIINPYEKGILKDEDFTGDIGDLILGNIKGRESDDEIIVFKSVGVSAQDIVTAKWIYEKAVEAGVGTEWK